MERLFRCLLLLLLMASGSTDEECGLPERVQQDQVLGRRWVLLRAFSDYPDGLDLVRFALSSVMEMKLLEDNKTIACIERNVLAGKCLNFYVNMTSPDPETSNHTLILMNPGVQVNDSVCSPYDDQGRVDAFSSCSDCLTLVYHVTFPHASGRMLLIYKAEGKHLDSEELKASKDSHMKLAECLKFNLEPHFTYDGQAGFCEQTDECFDSE